MKSFVLSLLLPATLSMAHTSTQPLPPLPNALACEGVIRIYGDPAFLNMSFYSHIRLTNLDEKPKWADLTGEIRHEDYDDKLTIDFSNGDQYSVFVFRKDDLESFHRGEITTLSGMYADGYDWADGFHTRAAILVHCVSMSKIL